MRAGENWSTDIPANAGFWYWWRQDHESTEIPAWLGMGPFGNDVFMPGKGWVASDKIGGEWWQSAIPFPAEYD